MNGTPTHTYRSWFPAIVNLPDGRTILKGKVFATDAGLIVYAQQALPDPVFSSPILLDKTPTPSTDYASEQRGHVIVTEAGRVTVTKSGACSSCGLRALLNWNPAWALVEAKWGE